MNFITDRQARTLVATFWVALIAVAVSSVTVVVILNERYGRAELFGWIEQLQQRVIALEVAVKELQTMQPPSKLQKQQVDQTKE